MKRRVLALVSVLVLSFGLTACGKFRCDLCGQEKSGKQYETMGGTICSDCNKELKQMQNELMDMLK